MTSQSSKVVMMLSPKNIYLKEVSVGTDVATVKLYNKFGHFAEAVQSYDQPDLLVLGKRTFEQEKNAWLRGYADRASIPLLLIDNMAGGPTRSFLKAGEPAQPGERVYPRTTIGVIHPEVLTMPDLFGQVARAVLSSMSKPETVQSAIHDVVIGADLEYDPDFTTHWCLAERQVAAGMPISSSSMNVPSLLELNGLK